MNDANQSIRNPANSGATVDTQDDARGGGGEKVLPPHKFKKTLKNKNPLKIF